MTILPKYFPHSLHCIFSILFLVTLLLYISGVKARTIQSSNIPAIFIFGDSTADPGNNNFIGTPFRSNFPPYGRDFPNQVPTGRFTNGRLVADFIAKYIGVKDRVPPYLDPSLSIEDLKTGVSFASAGSGFDPLTPTLSNVISMPAQVMYFKEYQAKMQEVIGKEKTKYLLNNALYIISAGTNDFVINYFTLPFRRKTFDLPNYSEFLFQQIRHFIQEIRDMGAKRIGFAGLTPMGCLPIVITLNSKHAILERGCIDSFSSAARDFNVKLQKELHAMETNISYPGSRLAYLNTYKILEAMVHTHKYGFDEVNIGCCGSGLLETTFLCNSKAPICSDPSKYIFWDSIHPTEKAYGITFHAFQSALDYLVKN